MADTTFVNGTTLTDADWFNDVNRLHYTIFGDPADDAAARSGLGLAIGTDVPAYAGCVIQRVEATPYTTYASDASASLPMDDTVPQKTEGSSYTSLSFTPKSATSRLVIRGQAVVCGNAANNVGALIVDTAINDALAVSISTMGGANHFETINVYAEVSAASTAARTYQLRLGAGTGVTFFINGNNSARFFGGLAGCKLSCEEIAA